MPNAANSASETPAARPKDAPEAAFDAAGASENAPPAPAEGAEPPPLLPPLGAGLRSIPPQAPKPSDPKRRSSAAPGHRAEAARPRGSRQPRGGVARRRVGVDLGGGAFPCPARIRRRSRGGDPGEAE